MTSDPDLENLEARLHAAERRAEAAERDRDWWMAQHDAVMKDWRLDIAILQPKGVTLQPTAGPPESVSPQPVSSAPVSAAPAVPETVSAGPASAQPISAQAVEPSAPARPASHADPLGDEGRQALAELVQFFDSRDGSIALQRDGRTLSAAFKRAASWVRKAAP